MPSSVAIGVMPSRISDSRTPSRSPMPAPDHTDHSSARHRQFGYSSPTRRVRSVSQSLAVA